MRSADPMTIHPQHSYMRGEGSHRSLHQAGLAVGAQCGLGAWKGGVEGDEEAPLGKVGPSRRQKPDDVRTFLG